MPYDRVSPQQKAEVTRSIKELVGLKTCSIGDGGNDVGMITAADVGVGIVGKEGKQAAMVYYIEWAPIYICTLGF